MKWRKLGKIFDPREHALFTELKEYAQSPQAVVLSDRVRVYFSTRERDGASMFLSHPAFVDFDKAFQGVLRVSNQPMLALGARGTFDEHGIFPFSPIRVGERIHAYTTGWTRRCSVATDSGIGLAISIDGGESFTRHGQGPVLGASLHEPFLVSDGFVTSHAGRFHMWYIYGLRWIRANMGAPPDRVYKIAHASSDDGINWTKSSRIVLGDELNADECQALPTVVSHAGRFHMVFCYRHATDFRRNPARAYRLGHATSTDLIHWHREVGPALDAGGTGDWDADMQCYPNLFHFEDKLYLLYNGNEFGRHGFGLAQLA